MAISGLQATSTPVAPDTGTTTVIPAAKSKVATASATPQDTVTLSSKAQSSSAGAIDIAPPVLLEVEELLTQGLTASQIAVSLKIPFGAVEVDAGKEQSAAATGTTTPASSVG